MCQGEAPHPTCRDIHRDNIAGQLTVLHGSVQAPLGLRHCLSWLALVRCTGALPADETTMADVTADLYMQLHNCVQ